MTPRDEATERQVRAADPNLSSWLSANAGSGKTRVLTDRVARLLLAGVDPAHVLCLTYTKAAASEMQNRLFQRLGRWAMLDDASLDAELAALGVMSAPDLPRARTLFARALETPGGLKIQTIHAFCAGVLRRFPLEAGVPPGFAEMDDRVAATLRDEVASDIAATRPDLVDEIGTIWSGDDLSALTKEIVARRDAFGGHEAARFRACLGLSSGDDIEACMARVFTTEAVAALRALIRATDGAEKTDGRVFDALSALLLDTPAPADLSVLEGLFLTGAGAAAPHTAKIGKVPTKARRAGMDPGHADALDRLMQTVEETRGIRLSLALLDKCVALHRFADAFLDGYDRAKAARGWLDFDDLIRRTLDLLHRPGLADWVLWKLDGGIDHVLIDEAQDTSPTQWRLIEALTAEMSAGVGASDGRRTIFVVGDPKQSIYSFQGARPEGFGRMRDTFRDRLSAADSPFQDVGLIHSFRSSWAILAAVDATVAPLPGVDTETVHRAFHADMPGRVDLWPPEPGAEDEDPPPWHDPVDRVSAASPTVRLARRLAGEVARMVAEETIPAENGTSRRPIGPGDVLILVQRRNALFHEIIAALKARGLDVAGADLVRLAGELAVKDIVATLSFLALPGDDLSLAAALRSPLFGLSEADLFGLAHERTGTLWQAFRTADGHHAARAILDDLRGKADFQRPFDLIQRLLVHHDGRARLIARLGAEAEDGIDAFLDQALAFETRQVPNLTAFLDWYAGEEVQTKRQAEGQGGRIRVMTVHGAKGLESPVVILPDTFREDRKQTDQIVPGPDGLAFWRAAKDECPAPLRQAMDAVLDADRAERNRLLYVAMTRAESWLIVCGAGKKAAQPGTWYMQVRDGLVAAGAGPLDPDAEDGETGLRLSHGDWTAPPLKTHAPDADATTSLPDWATALPPLPDRRATPLSPSDLGGAKALPGEGDETEIALLRGTRLHLLLERLPTVAPDRRADAARRLLHDADPDETLRLTAEALACLDAPDLAPVFAPDALVEVGIASAADTLLPRPILGVIDRLLVRDDHILAVDFKSNRAVPATANDVPEGLLRQMGAYALMLEPLYPDRRVEVALLWTRTATLMPLPHDMVRQAARRGANLDALTART